MALNGITGKSDSVLRPQSQCMWQDNDGMRVQRNIHTCRTGGHQTRCPKCARTLDQHRDEIGETHRQHQQQS